MPVNTQPNVGLVLDLDGATYECQVIDASFRPPGVGASTVTETACPDGRVAEPGAVASGSLTGNAFADSQDTGLTWILAQAYENDATLAYTLTFWPELGATKAMEWTGEARVNSYTLDFSKPGVGRHPIDLEIVSASLARPTGA